MDNETHFVMKNSKVVQPEVPMESLELYYDVKGKKDTDSYNNKLLDLSGNAKHAELTNFAFDKGSGYSDGLVFDGVDDILTRPVLTGLTPTSMTYQMNSNILTYSADGTVKRVQDGRVVERRGVNLIRNGNFFNGTSGWGQSSSSFGALSVTNEVVTYKFIAPSAQYSYISQNINTTSGDLIYISFGIKPMHSNITQIYIKKYYDLEPSKPNEWNYYSGVFHAGEGSGNAPRFIHNTETNYKVGDIIQYKEAQMINLTATYGVGNEPTLEEIQANPEAWAWTPNPMDLIETTDLKGNIMGDVEGIIDDLNKTPILSGNPIYTDKADDAVVHVGVDGKSVQNAGSGKNLFEVGYLSNRDNFILATYSIPKKATNLKGSTRYILSAKKVVAPELGRQFVLNIHDGTNGIAKWRDPNWDSSIIMSVYNMNSTTVKIADRDDFRLGFTTPESGLIYFSYYEMENGLSPEGDWFTDRMIEPQLEEGSTATAYEPSAPTPDNPIPINSLDKSFDIVSSVSKENLMLNSHGDSILRPTYGSVPRMEDGKMAIPFESSPNITAINTAGSSPLMNEGETYTFSFYAKASSQLVLKSLYINGSLNNLLSNTTITTKWERYHATFVIPKTGKLGIHLYPTILNGDGTYKTFYISDWKLEKGEISPYSQAPEDILPDTQTPTLYKTNILLSEPLRSVGDVKDRLFLDTDGLWKVERNVGEHLLTIGQHWSAWADGVSENMNSFYTTGVPNFTRSKEYTSTHFLKLNNLRGTDLTGMTQDGSGVTLSFTVPKISYPTLQSWKDWVGKNNVFIQYGLATPTIETLSAEQQTKLNNIQSFKGSNYVYTVDKIGILPELHGVFKPADWYKENLLINSLKIYNRALSNEEMLKNYNTEKKRWGV